MCIYIYIYIYIYTCIDNVPQYILHIQTQFSSVAQSCPTLFDPIHCSMPGFSVHHQLPELAVTHVHQVGDAIQLFHPLLSRSSAFNQLSLSNNLGLVPGISKDTKTWKCSILLYKVAYYLHITYACLPVYFKSSLMSL